MKTDNKVLIVLPTAILGGAERVACSLASYLAESGYTEICIYFMSRGKQSAAWEDASRTHVNIKLVYANCKRERESLYSLLLFMFRNKFNLVYTTHTHVNAFISLLRTIGVFRCNYLIGRESTVISERFTGIRAFEFTLMYKLYRSHDLLICQTQYMYDALIKVRGARLARSIRVIGNPVNLIEIMNRKDQIQLRFDSSYCNIICVGRLVSIKNYSLVIEALGRLSKSLLDQVFLHFIGSGEEYDSLVKIAKKNKVKNIEFHGNVDNPYAYMSQADIGIVSSLKEGFPNVLIEMMAAGTRYILSTPCAGDIDSLEGVFVVPDFQSSTMTSAIEDAITGRFNKISLYQKQIKERSVNQFWKKISAELDLLNQAAD